MSRQDVVLRIIILFVLILGATVLIAGQPKTEEKKKARLISLIVIVPSDCKITINNKTIEYEKFDTIMEFAPNAFTIDEIAYKGGQFTSLKLRSRE